MEKYMTYGNIEEAVLPVGMPCFKKAALVAVFARNRSAKDGCMRSTVAALVPGFDTHGCMY